MTDNEKLKQIPALIRELRMNQGDGSDWTEDLFSRAADALEAAEKALGEATVTPTDDGRIAPEDGMTLEELSEAISNWSPEWDGDEAMHALIYRFIEHYAALDAEVYAAREEHDFEPDAEILFRYDDEAGTLVRVPQGEPSEAQCRILPLQHRVQNPSHHGSAAQGEPSDAQVKANAQSYAADRYREVIYLSEYNAAVSAFVEGVEWARAAGEVQ